MISLALENTFIAYGDKKVKDRPRTSRNKIVNRSGKVSLTDYVWILAEL